MSSVLAFRYGAGVGDRDFDISLRQGVRVRPVLAIRYSTGGGDHDFDVSLRHGVRASSVSTFRYGAGRVSSVLKFRCGRGCG